jgi:tetratricopeptide repeat protein 21B
MSKVEASRGSTLAAERLLEQALSGDFSVRTLPLFRFVQAIVRSQSGKVDEALSELEKLIQMPEFCAVGLAEGPGRMATDSLRLTDDDIVASYVVFSSLLSKSGRVKEARKILSNGKVLFSGTSQEVHILIASSQLAVERNDFDSAIRMLDKVDASSPTFLRAQLIKAEILLTNCRNKEGFIKCFQQLVERTPISKSYALLGEAYIRILNPEAAVSAFEQAFKRDSSNLTLRARIGKALVATHEYHRAIDFYESCLRDADKVDGTGLSGDSVPLAHDLARLYIKLGRMESASRVLYRALHNGIYKDIDDMREDVETLRLLSNVQSANDQIGEVIETLKKAKDIQKEIVTTVRSNSISSSEIVEIERSKLSDVCLSMGSWYFEQSGNDDSAEKFLNESIQHNPQNTKAMFALAKLRFRRNETEQCAAQCNKILSANSSDEEAAVMLADILFQENKSDSRECVSPLQKLLQTHPNRYNALNKLIVYLRRLGALEEVPDYIDRAAKADNRSGSHMGLHFCKGLYARYTNDVVGAVKEFNMCRKDATWGSDALVHMIELYLNPDQEGIWEEKEGKEGDEASSTPLDDAQVENIRVAESLLEELRPLARYTIWT